MRPQCSHITRKRGIYYFRRRIPGTCNREISISLKTRNFRQAEFLASILDDVCDTTFGDPMIDYERYAPILKAERDRYLRSAFNRILSAPPGYSIVREAFKNTPSETQRSDLKDIQWLLDQFTADYQRRDLRGPEGRIRELMEANGIPEHEFMPFGLCFFRMLIDQLSQQKNWIENGIVDPARLYGESSSPSGQASPSSVSEAQQSRNSGLRLSDALPDFVQLMVSTGEWRGQTEAQNRATYRLFLSHCGDKPVSAYTRQDCASFYDTLRKLPSLYSKKPDWANLTAAEVVNLTAGQDLERLSMKTVKRHFSALGRLFDYLRKRGEYAGENPAYGFDFPEGRTRARDKRKMWKGEALAKLFSSPIWAGCKSSSRRSSPGELIIQDEHYWLPLLGAYHGNRLEEFAQLHRSDVRQEKGIWYLDINDDNSKQIKNAQSARKVPIHPKVIEFGFLEYVQSIAKNPEDRVFPHMKRGGPDKKYGFYYSKSFSAYRKQIGVYQKGLDYHSFRHGVTTQLFSVGVSKVVVDALTGHEGEGTSERVYLKEIDVSALHEAICKIEWPEIDSAIRSKNRTNKQ